MGALKKHAAELGMDVAQFEKDYQDLENKKLVDAEKAEATSMQITGTPGFFVNGRFLRGAKPFEEFATLINEELEKKGLPVPAEARG